jgi:hypothetical protein
MDKEPSNCSAGEEDRCRLAEKNQHWARWCASFRRTIVQKQLLGTLGYLLILQSCHELDKFLELARLV